jgi:hypothetical protein
VFTGGGWDLPILDLKRSKHENLLRLAQFLKLKYGLEDMSHRQLAKLVRWRITRDRMRR